MRLREDGDLVVLAQFFGRRGGRDVRKTRLVQHDRRRVGWQNDIDNCLADVKPVRCAIYTRVSTDQGLEQDFNSLDAQREACEAFIASQKRALGDIKGTLQNSTATIIVEFVSEQINIVRDAAGQIIDGDEDRLVDVRDRWTFQRDLKSTDPTWLLIHAEQPAV